MNGMGPAMMAFMGLATLAVLAALAALVVGVIWLARRSVFVGRSEQGEKGEDVLRRRYAAGEIGEDEYHHRLATLRGHPTAPGPADATDWRGNPQP
ncbi:SHOCT domain-containing protein [Micromonospora aurantiaca (nom. illeg.)]|uniref:SHOCT domain-containing protein n=1 Tax=Micromonospora aurantiaca (nom. illeg.) TaxID=47850 RepID=UPI001656F558|nr:SHOCT domain-containing protein [Micromonospora aurantiaca]MBC9003657.1 SHOCT domain-containing protein [Micromonospora aurantiaca]